MARADLYLLDKEQPFWINFFKGAAGLWALLMLVIAINVALSTYLSAIIAWLASLVWLLLGLPRDFIAALARGDSPEGGPMESLYRLAQRRPVAALPSEQTALGTIINRSDQITQLFFKLVLFFTPDLSNFWLSRYVEEGFDISLKHLGLAVLVLLAYSLPCALLAYYTMKMREVASAT
jgi:hypothetical protein